MSPPTRSNSSAASCATRAAGRRRSRELAARAEQLPVPDGVQPKDLSDYKLIGREGRLRVDSVPKILGATRFTIDVSVPGMLTAVVLHPPRFGATVASVDDAGGAGRARRDRGRADRGGRRRRRRNGRRRAARAARAGRRVGRHRTPSGGAPPSCSPSTSGCSNRGENAVAARDDGDADGVLGDAPTVVDGTYTLPYLAHATMEPNNAACRMREDGVLEVWASTESPEYTRMSPPRVAGIDKEQVGGSRHVRRGIVRAALERRARPHGRGRAGRASARLEAPDQGPVAARGGFQESAATARWPFIASGPAADADGRLTA